MQFLNAILPYVPPALRPMLQRSSDTLTKTVIQHFPKTVTQLQGQVRQLSGTFRELRTWVGHQQQRVSRVSDQVQVRFAHEALRIRRTVSDQIADVETRMIAAADYVDAYQRSWSAEDTANNYGLLSRLDPATANSRWRAALTHLRQQGVRLPNDRRLHTYQSFLSYLQDNGIAHPERIRSVRTALTLVHNRQHMAQLGRHRPIAVIVMARADHNGAFRARSNLQLVDTFVRTGQFDVVYVEASTDTEAMSHLRRIHQQTGQPIGRVVFAGHGSPTSLWLDDEGKIAGQGLPTEAARIDTSDFTVSNDFNGLDDIIAPDGQVLLWACSNASDSTEQNMVNTVGRALPGRDVFATTEPSNIRHIHFRGSRIQSVQWREDTAYQVNMTEAERLPPYQAPMIPIGIAQSRPQLISDESTLELEQRMSELATVSAIAAGRSHQG